MKWLAAALLVVVVLLLIEEGGASGTTSSVISVKDGLSGSGLATVLIANVLNSVELHHSLLVCTATSADGVNGSDGTMVPAIPRQRPVTMRVPARGWHLLHKGAIQVPPT